MSNLNRTVARLNARELNPRKRRWARKQALGRVKTVYRDGDLMSYVHPTKGARSRYWPKPLPTFASKIDMWAVTLATLGRAHKYARELDAFNASNQVEATD